MSTIGSSTVAPPALLTRMSTAPKRCSAEDMRDSTPSRRLTSAATKIPRSPAPSSSRTLMPFSSLRPLSTTEAPSAKSARAMARPMPPVLPVMTATLPST